MSIHIRLYFTRFCLLIMCTLALITLEVTLAKPRVVADDKATAAIKTIEAVLNAPPTLTPSATPNKSETATAQAAAVQTAVAATLTARPTAKPTRKPLPTRTPKPAPTSTPAPTATPPPIAPPTATNTPAILPPTSTAAPQPAMNTPAPLPPTATPAAPARPDLVSDFETFGVWQRGNEAWGTFTQSSENKSAGAAAAKLDYDFTPAQAENDFVVFVLKPPLPIPGQPKGLTMQIFGDSSSNFLNAWVQDSVGQVWQFTFGRINHSGWQMLSAPLDPGLGWPNGVVQNNQSATLSYPLHLYALVLDGEPRQITKSTLFFDDILTTDNPALPNLAGGATTGAAAAPAPAPAEPAAPAPETIADESCGADPSSITAGQTALLYWKFTGVKEVYFEGQGVLGIDSKLVKPTQTATYTVNVIRNDGSETSCVITVQVK